MSSYIKHRYEIGSKLMSIIVIAIVTLIATIFIPIDIYGSLIDNIYRALIIGFVVVFITSILTLFFFGKRPSQGRNISPTIGGN